MTYRVRLALCVCVLAMGAVLLALAQEQIATAADLIQSSAEFDSSALLTFDPAATLSGDNLFGMDDQSDLSTDSALLPDALGLNDSAIIPQDQAGAAPQDVQADPGAPQTVQVNPSGPQSTPAAPPALPASRAGWPKTTAATTLAGPVARPPTQGKWIDVNISNETVTAYIGSTPILTVLTSTGIRRHPTIIGTFHIWAKVKSQRMTGGSYAAHDHYSLPGVPNIMYFYRGFALHGTYWHRNFGHPMSHGCVNLTLDDAAWFYSWASVGTIVRTHY